MNKPKKLTKKKGFKRRNPDSKNELIKTLDKLVGKRVRIKQKMKYGNDLDMVGKLHKTQNTYELIFSNSEIYFDINDVEKIIPNFLIPTVLMKA